MGTYSFVKKIDWLSILLYLILVAMGTVTIFSTTNSYDYSSSFFSSPFNKQMLFVSTSIIVCVFLFFVKINFYESFTEALYLIGVILLVGVLFFGKQISGATSWYSVGGFGFQPSEFAKITTSLMFAKFISQSQIKITDLKMLITALGIVGVPALLIVLQPDAGTVLIFIMLLLILFEAGINKLYLFILIIMTVTFPVSLKIGTNYTIIISSLLSALIILWVYRKYNKMSRQRKTIPIYVSLCLSSVILVSVATNFVYDNVLKQHHQDRFKFWLNLENDSSKITKLKRGIGYNTYQSEEAMSLGRLYGKGFLKGTRTQGHFIPEQHTDYIFSAVGEEWGFWGTLTVITIFSLLILRLLYRLGKQKNKFYRTYGYCVVVILFTHYVINISMVIGLLPTIGIPLPFFSYGGSSFFCFSVMLFIFLRLDAQGAYEISFN